MSNENVDKLKEILQENKGDGDLSVVGYGGKEERTEAALGSQDKTLDVVSVEDLQNKVSDVIVVGNGSTFQLICKASSKSQGWMKSTKACDVGHGCIVQVTTQQGDNVAEALTFVPGVTIETDENGNRVFVPIRAVQEQVKYTKRIK